MISKQDFDRKNKDITRRNAEKVQLKFGVIFTCAIVALLFLCVGSVLPNAFLFMFLLSCLFILPIILVLRIKPIPYYTFDQYAQVRAEQKFQIKQAESQYAVQHGYPGSPIRDSRYIPDDMRRDVLLRDSYRCRYCGSTSYLEMDHIIPLSRGGATSYENLQVLCRGCNMRKGSR